ncbi:MAG TPA: ankyrin repeat domain-containing protein, partial [Chthonomonadaceae bacterium]|nr:ankyrin repeat domain-containing protein [Chthonomonadaceae bacterium]
MPPFWQFRSAAAIAAIVLACWSLLSACVAAGAQAARGDAGSGPALVVAAQKGDAAAVEALLTAKTAVNEREPRLGRTALSAATVAGHGDVVKTLLDHHADVDCRDKDGTTPLMNAANVGYAGIVALLLDHGARPNLQDRSGSTALIHAASKNH